MSTARTTRLSRCRRTSVRLLSASGAASVVLASFLLGALDFALVKATTTPRRVEPFGLLEGLPGEAVAQAREWERHLVEMGHEFLGVVEDTGADVSGVKKGLLCWIRGHDQVIARPGRGGHMPPRSSMARATRASGERNPKAMRVRSRSFVFTLSTRAFDSPWLSAALMPARCSRMERASFTNAGSRQRQAHFSQASSSAMPSAPLS